MKGIAVGLNKGFITTKLANIRERPALRKGTKGKRTGLVRQVIRECSGFTPYEKRVYEIKIGYGID
jgi:large subunit ribosomal protein L36e